MSDIFPTERWLLMLDYAPLLVLVPGLLALSLLLLTTSAGGNPRERRRARRRLGWYSGLALALTLTGAALRGLAGEPVSGTSLLFLPLAGALALGWGALAIAERRAARNNSC